MFGIDSKSLAEKQENHPNKVLGGHGFGGTLFNPCHHPMVSEGWGFGTPSPTFPYEFIAEEGLQGGRG